MQRNKYLDQLVEVLLKIENRQEMYNFLYGLLSAKELEELPNRLQIVKMLKKGITQQEIAEKLKVGIATVTRGSRELNLGRFKYI